MNDKKYRLLLVDDHELFLEGLRYIIDNLADDIEIVAIASDGQEALEIAKHERLDVVLMDVRMPGMDGVEATRNFSNLYPDVRIIMLTTFDDDEYVHHALQYGAFGYILKSIRPEDLLNAIRAVMSGQMLVDGKVRSSFFSFRTDPIEEKETSRNIRTSKAFGASGSNKSHTIYDRDGLGRFDHNCQFPLRSEEPHEKKNVSPNNDRIDANKTIIKDLTRREREVLRLILESKSNKQISEILRLSDHSVRNYVSNIYLAFGINDRFELIQELRDIDA